MIQRAVSYVTSLGLLSFCALANAQSYVGPDPTRLEAQVAGLKAMVSHWEALGSWQLSLAIAVGVLGAVVAGLQKFEGKKWCSLTVVFAGVLISLITVLAKEAFDGDHRTYRRLASAAKEEIFQAEISLDILKSDATSLEDKQDAANEVLARISRIGRLGAGIGDSANPSALAEGADALGIISKAHAQQASWTSQQRIVTPTAIRFVGSGSASSLQGAQKQSLQNAQRAAAEDLRIPLDTVTRFARPINSVTQFDAAHKTYRHFTLLEVNKSLVPR